MGQARSLFCRVTGGDPGKVPLNSKAGLTSEVGSLTTVDQRARRGRGAPVIMAGLVY